MGKKSILSLRKEGNEMLKQIIRFKSALILVFCLTLCLSNAFAQGYGNGDNRGNGRQDARVQVSRDSQRHGQGGRHYYRNGRWYRRGWFGWPVAEPVLYNGVLVDSLPPTYTPVVVQGNTYYYGDNTYFQQLPEGGYTVVSVPSSNTVNQQH
jgi:hypothetical protein